MTPKPFTHLLVSQLSEPQGHLAPPPQSAPSWTPFSGLPSLSCPTCAPATCPYVLAPDATAQHRPASVFMTRRTDLT